MTCRKQTVAEALKAATRSKRRTLTKTEKRVISAAAKNTPVLICGPTRQYEGVKRGRGYAGYPKVSTIRSVKFSPRRRRK